MNETAVSPIERVSATPAACELIEELKRTTARSCSTLRRLLRRQRTMCSRSVSSSSVASMKVGDIVGCEFWMDRERLRRWVGSHPLERGRVPDAAPVLARGAAQPALSDPLVAV